jgi:N-acetyltransferase
MCAMRPDLQPVLSGVHVLLRPVHADDWDGMFAAASDPEIWAGHPIRNRFEEPAFRAFFDDAIASRSALTIVDRQTGSIIGSSRYHGFDPERREIEIGWTFLARAYWGGVYNREIKRLMLDHAFQFVDTVIFLVGETNQRSRRAMEKIGGVRRSGTCDRTYGEFQVSHVVYEIRKPSIERQNG